MKQTPLVSIIIPFFDQDEYLLETLESVKNQTYRNFEIVIADDCSPRATAEELVAHENWCSIKVVRHAENRGLACARNTAILNSSGKYILPLDSDDKLSPKYLEVTVDAITNSADGEWDAVYTDIQMFEQQTDIVEQNCDLMRLMIGVPVACTFLYKREIFDAIGGYNRDVPISADHSFWISLVSKGFRVKHIDQPLFLYRRHLNSMSSDIKQNAPRVMKMLVSQHRDLYVENLDEVMFHMEERFWDNIFYCRKFHKANENGDFADSQQQLLLHNKELHEEWLKASRNYHELYREWEQTHSNYLALEREYKNLAERMAASESSSQGGIPRVMSLLERILRAGRGSSHG